MWVETTVGTDMNGLTGNFRDAFGDIESICCREETDLRNPLLVEDRTSVEKTVVELSPIVLVTALLLLDIAVAQER